MTAEELNELMDKKDMTVEEVARACCVTPDAVRKWKRGLRTIPKSAPRLLTFYLSERK